MNFLEEIAKEDEILYRYVFGQIESIQSKLDSINNTFAEYTDHSSSHSEKVMEIGSKLNTCGLNIYEKAVFVLASYFHDIGMCVPEDDLKKHIDDLGKDINIDYFLQNIVNTEQLSSITEEERKKYIVLNQLRQKHGQLSADYILVRYPKSDRASWINNTYIWENVALVCKAHTLDVEEIVSNDEHYSTGGLLENDTQVNLLYLALLLRLSDICHFSRDRAFPFFFKDKSFSSKKSENIWRYYADVVTTCPDRKSNTIKIHASCENFYNHRAIINNTKNIEKELLNCHHVLNKKNSECQFNWKYVDSRSVVKSSNAKYLFHDMKFRLNKNKIIDLLMGDKLYSNRLFALRECVQNSIDSINVVKTKIPDGHYIYIDYNDKESPVLDIYDSGTGMNLEIVYRNFLSVGSKSYWYSEQALREWNLDKKSLKLIADHGIGALSFFMIAKKIELFTKYHFSSSYHHILIDDCNDSIICFDTDLSKFPKYISKETIAQPWDLNHGTCVRFHLKEKIEFSVLLEFLAVHIPRCPHQLYFNYNLNEFRLENIWHFRRNIDSYSHKRTYIDYEWSSESPADLEDKKHIDRLYKKLYVSSRDYYENPPVDKAVTDNKIEDQSLTGKVNINYRNEESVSIRISQNGILVRNAFDFVERNRCDNLLIEAFGFDIDISNDYCFQLDAERTTIVDNDYNKNILARIEKLLIDKYFKLVSVIESSIYFHCGGKFYHGIADVIFEHKDSVKCFNGSLKRIFTEGKLEQEYVANLDAFDSGKLYMTGIKNCCPVSVNDLKDFTKLQLLITRQSLSDQGLKVKSHGDSYVDTDRFLEKIGIEIDDNTAYLSDKQDSFLCPLFRNFQFHKIIENDYALLYKLETKEKPDNQLVRLELDKLFENQDVKKRRSRVA